MKVFLSHSKKDKDFVEKLTSELRVVDIEPWLCELDIVSGDDFVAEIEKGLKETDVTVLFWSPDAARSKWTGKEWRSVLARETEESRTRLALVLLRDAELPELLRTKDRIDARFDREKALRQTVEWLIRLRDMRRVEEINAANYILDFEPTDFVGRTKYLEQLHTILVENRGKCLLWGETGSGKSVMALKFAWRAQGAFDAVVFQHCGQRSPEEIGVELAERIGLDVKGLPPDQQIIEAKKWLTDRRTLLILDDIWSPGVKELIPAPPLSVQSLSILCTSRQRSLPWIKPPLSLEVTSFLEEEAESLFLIYLGEKLMMQHGDALMDLAARVERLPIAVGVAAEMLSRQFNPLDEAAQTIKLNELRNEIHDIPELFKHAITSQPEQEQNLLRAMAVCHPDGFWLPLPANIIGLEKAKCGKSRDRLVNASLVRPVDLDRQRFRLHTLLREHLLMSAPIKELKNKYTKVLYELFEDWEKGWRECQECLPEVIPAIRMLRNEGSISQAVWLAYRGYATGMRVGEFDAAHRILKEEEQFWEDQERPVAKDILQANYGNQALILQVRGQLKRAMELHEKQEALCIELGNKDGLQASYGNQALILQARGQLKDAMALHKKEEALCIELNNKDGLLRSYSNQALILKAWGQFEKAMALLKKVEALCIELGNKDGLQASYGNQALILQAWGRLDEAMELHEKQEALCIELGNKDGLQANYGNQALILQTWGQFEKAMALLKKVEALCIELGNKNGLQASYGNQALILQTWGQFEKAMALLKKAEALCIELGNKDGLQRSYGNQALILKAWGQLDEAMALHKKEEALCIELGNKSGSLRSYGNQALILQAWGQLDEAMALHKKQEALSIKLGNKQALGVSYGNQALILQDWGQLDEAMALHKKQEALFIELGNKNGLQTSFGNQATNLLASGQLDEAMKLHKKEEALCIELGNKKGLQRSYGNQAIILKARGQLEEAMALHKKQEVLCIELGLRSALGYCYWFWGLLAREQQDRNTEREKLKEALQIFTELNMQREKEAVQNELDQIMEAD